jgi:formate hydrogenlyase subunit 7
MSPRGWLGRIRRTGRISEPALPLEASGSCGTGAGGTGAGAGGAVVGAGPLRGSVQVRHVDAGSCNGCEIEIAAAFGPVYDAERYGARLVASPRHADLVLVSGVVTRNMAEPLRRTVEATPRPRLVVAMGDCANNCGVFAGGYGVLGPVRDVVEVDLEVPGCPPRPEAVIAALRRVTRR